MRYRWRKDSAQYATISNFRFDVLANVTAANTTGYISLFNSTHNTQVTASELSWTETAITRKSVTVAGNATNFAELDDFQPLGKRTTTSGGNLLIYKADLYIELTSLSRAEVYQRVGGRHNTGGFDEIFNDGHVLYDATRYSNPIVSFEAVGVYNNTDPPANDAVYLYDHGVNDDGNSGGSNVSSSIVTGWNNVTQSRQRSSRLTLTTNNRYIIATDKIDTNPSARLTISQAFIVISAFASPPSGTPTITSVSPTSGLQGTNPSVTISGTNLIGATLSTSWSGLTFTQVNWNGAGTSVTATFNIAGTAALGTPTIQLTASGGNTTTQAFSITPPPSITSLSPTSAPVGDSVTITGQGFGASQGTSVVTINGTAATTISTWSATSIQATVPSAATTTGFVVVNVAGVPSNNVSFTVPPKITSLMPPAAAIASPITISGTTFGSSGTVTFFNGVAGIPTGWNSTTITVPVPANAFTGPVVVTVGGAASNNYAFTTIPSITTLSPSSGGPSTYVTLTGTAFGPTQGPSNAPSTVTFNGASANPSSWS